MKFTHYFLAIVIFFGSFSLAQAATIQTGASCSLFNAVQSAQTNTAVGGCVAGSGAADVIVLNQNETLTSEYNSSGNAFPVITTPMTIRGNGFTVSMDNQTFDPFRLFEVTNTTFTLERFDTLDYSGVNEIDGGFLKAANSTLTVLQSSFDGYKSDMNGGVIYLDGGRLTIRGSEFIGNISSNGGAIFIKNAPLNVTSSLFSVNNAWQHGGAIVTRGETPISIDSSIFEHNTSYYGAAIDGGLEGHQKKMTINTSEFRYNHSFEWGGTVTWRGWDGEVEIKNSTFWENIGSGESAGFENSDGEAKITVVNSTFSGNISNGPGAAFSNRGEEVELHMAYNTFMNNSSWTNEGALASLSSMAWINSSIENSIFGSNTGGDCHFVSTVNLSIVGNLSDGGPCGTTAATGVSGAIANNGGLTKTHKLNVGSNAIDTAVTNPLLVKVACPTADQRSIARPFDGNGDNVARCDIGAFESNKKVFQQAAVVSVRASDGNLMEKPAIK